jgi:hypothetical protein
VKSRRTCALSVELPANVGMYYEIIALESMPMRSLGLAGSNSRGVSSSINRLHVHRSWWLVGIMPPNLVHSPLLLRKPCHNRRHDALCWGSFSLSLLAQRIPAPTRPLEVQVVGHIEEACFQDQVTPSSDEKTFLVDW